jgi:hypothetical protein
MLACIEADTFTFILGQESITTALWEAVLISPAVYASLQADPTCRTFALDGPIGSQDFAHFLEYVRSPDLIDISREMQISFLTICRLLQNEALSLVFLASLHAISTVDLRWDTDSIDAYSTVIACCDATIDYCASLFHLFTTDELRMLDRGTIHNLLNSPSLAITSEDALLQTIMELDDVQFEYWKYIDFRFLSESGIARFVQKFDFKFMTIDIWEQIKLHLKKVVDEDRLIKRFPITFNSMIIQVFLRVLKKFRGRMWRLLYRGTRDGFKASDFHKKCDGHSNILSVILTTMDFVFGGFTPVTWDSSGGYKPDITLKSFVFTLKNPRNSERKFRMTTFQNAIYCHASHGPTFGSGHEIYVSDPCNTNRNSSTNLGTAYLNDTGIDGKQVFTGEQTFTEKEIEVFSIDL